MNKEGRKLFKSGTSFEEFVNLDKDSYKEKTLYIYNNININDEFMYRIKNIKKVNVLICAEMWCPDCMINVPVVEKMRQVNNNINISIVEKGDNEDYFSKYVPREIVKIPTFIFFDDEFNEIGSFVERPNYVKEVQSSDNQPLKIVTMRKYKNGEYTSETLKDILKIVGY
ncbi:MAG TPA: thioredoxin family protein [Tissierellales bacterium]|nr:thioredoxin family protein [Tissierellales bacterium]